MKRKISLSNSCLLLWIPHPYQSQQKTHSKLLFLLNFKIMVAMWHIVVRRIDMKVISCLFCNMFVNHSKTNRISPYFNHQLFVVNVSIGYRLLFWQQSHAISGGVTGTPVTTISSIELGLLYLFNKSDVFFIFYISNIQWKLINNMGAGYFIDK